MLAALEDLYVTKAYRINVAQTVGQCDGLLLREDFGCGEIAEGTRLTFAQVIPAALVRRIAKLAAERVNLDLRGIRPHADHRAISFFPRFHLPWGRCQSRG